MTKTTILALLLCAFAGWLPGAVQVPVIESAAINSVTNQITISGVNLLPATGMPAVGLGNAGLTVVSATAATIVATLPPSLPPGTYALRVTVGTLSARFDVAYTQAGAGTLTLPYLGQVTSSGNAFEVEQFGASSTAIYGVGVGTFTIGVSGQGGAAAIEEASAGSGVYGQGGAPVANYSYGGNGGEFYGGGIETSGNLAGSGVLAQGGDSTGAGGDAVVAFGGNGGGYAGNGIEAVPGSGGTDGLGYGIAGYFGGVVTVAGNLNKAGGSFVIDHPTDPEHKYLYHSFVESPDMKNIYDGTVITDGSGTAVVKMPEWFEALNRDFRYQLTAIGQFAQAIVASKIASGQFVIKTDKPGVEVSWQVTGIRQDAWANAHRIPVEVEKAAPEQGYYLHPELFGHAGEPDIHALHRPRPAKQER
jgi:hypothetical protein